MKHELHIDDWLEDERDGLGEELFGALGELRPDPEDFARGVAERIAEAEGQDPVQQLEGHPALRWAAGLLPPILLPKGIAKLGFGAGGAATTKLGLKLVPGLAILPIVSVLMVVLTLVLALRGLVTQREVRDQADDRAEARVEVAMWWRRNLIPAVVAIALLFVLLLRAPTDALVLLLLFSTLVLVGITGRLAAAGFATRLELGRRLGGGLMLTVMWGLQLPNLHREVLPGPLLTGWVLPILSLGAALCLALAYAGRRGGLGRSLGVALAIWFVVLSGFGLLYRSIGKQLAEPADLRAKVVAGQDPTLFEPGRWDAWLGALGDLEAAGQPLPDLTALRAGIHARLADGTDINPLYVPELLRFGRGFLPDSEHERWRDDYTLDGILTDDVLKVGERELGQVLLLGGQAGYEAHAVAWFRTKLEMYRTLARAAGDTSSSYDGSILGSSGRSAARELRRIEQQLESPAWKQLLRADEVTDADIAAVARDELARRVLAAPAAPDDWQVLRQLVLSAELFEATGLAQRVPDLAPAAHAALLATWTPTDDGRQGAFPGKPETTEDGRPATVERLTFVWGDSTATAVTALARWGLPAPSEGQRAIDLAALERYLLQNCHEYAIADLDSYSARAIGSLALLRSLPELAAAHEARVVDRSLLAMAMDHRLLLAALLFAGFAVVATWRAPVESVEPLPFKTDLQRALLGQGEGQLPDEGVTWRTFLRRAVLDARAKDDEA